MKKFSILITTKNRKNDLLFTLNAVGHLMDHPEVDWIICDDGSSDGTFETIKEQYPSIHLIQNKESKGLIYSRNRLLQFTKSEYAISIDDDLHFITKNPLALIDDYFTQHPECGLIGFRIFWSTAQPFSEDTDEVPVRVKSFAGGAHVVRMDAWRQIPDYPSWFIFHGEEDFASYEMFKKGIEIHYLPSVLVHHRVDLKARKSDSDYTVRLRRSLRSGWYLYFMFFPLRTIPSRMMYSIWIQLKTKVFIGDFKALQALVLAFLDLIASFPKIIKASNRLSWKQYLQFQKLEPARIYWRPKGIKKRIKFNILISTKNRRAEVGFTLDKIDYLLSDDSVECVVFDDGSTDGTFEFIRSNYPKVIMLRNEVSKGYLYCRNKMLNESNADYAISLDDDAHFITKDPLVSIESHFMRYPNCGLLAFRLFWSVLGPSGTTTQEEAKRVKSFVGCGHVWRMEAWRDIPNYPEWFMFYGEEDFAAYELFKKNREVHYLPEILINHRVDMRARKHHADYTKRLRRSLSTGWFLYLMFFPLRTIPKKLIYSIWIQMKTKVFRGDYRAFIAIIRAIIDILYSLPRIVKHGNRLSRAEYTRFKELEDTKVYWKPEK